MPSGSPDAILPAQETAEGRIRETHKTVIKRKASGWSVTVRAEGGAKLYEAQRKTISGAVDALNDWLEGATVL
ncbi:MAG TPA: hypothetical protein VGM54_10140 [Chthoniobacter sp.]